MDGTAALQWPKTMTFRVLGSEMFQHLLPDFKITHLLINSFDVIWGDKENNREYRKKKMYKVT